jgi:hypothetical protein
MYSTTEVFTQENTVLTHEAIQNYIHIYICTSTLLWAHSPPTSAKVTKTRMYTSTPPYTFIAYCLIS